VQAIVRKALVGFRPVVKQKAIKARARRSRSRHRHHRRAGIVNVRAADVRPLQLTQNLGADDTPILADPHRLAQASAPPLPPRPRCVVS
jgi:hypothetical protein